MEHEPRTRTLGRRKPVTCGERVPAGVLLRAVASDRTRHRQAQFECRHCHSIETARLSQLRSGDIGSCGCLSKKGFRLYQEGRVRKLDRYTRARFFGYVVRAGIDGASQITGQDKYLLGTAARLHRQWLRNHPALQEIAAAARRSGNYTAVARRFGITEFCVSYVLRVWKKLQEEARLRAQHTRAISKWFIGELRFGIADALDTITDREKHGRWFQRPEFTKSELDRTKKSKFGWILAYLREGGFVPDDLQHSADKFLDAVQRTLTARKLRKINWLRCHNIGATCW